MKLLIRIGGRIMAEDKLFSGESKNIEYKVTVPEKSEKYMKTVVAFANGRGGRIYAEGTDFRGRTGTGKKGYGYPGGEPDI